MERVDRIESERIGTGVFNELVDGLEESLESDEKETESSWQSASSNKVMNLSKGLLSTRQKDLGAKFRKAVGRDGKVESSSSTKAEKLLGRDDEHSSSHTASKKSRTVRVRERVRNVSNKLGRSSGRVHLGRSSKDISQATRMKRLREALGKYWSSKKAVLTGYQKMVEEALMRQLEEVELSGVCVSLGHLLCSVTWGSGLVFEKPDCTVFDALRPTQVKTILTQQMCTLDALSDPKKFLKGLDECEESFLQIQALGTTYFVPKQRGEEFFYPNRLDVPDSVAIEVTEKDFQPAGKARKWGIQVDLQAELSRRWQKELRAPNPGSADNPTLQYLERICLEVDSQMEAFRSWVPEHLKKPLNIAGLSDLPKWHAELAQCELWKVLFSNMVRCYDIRAQILGSPSSDASKLLIDPEGQRLVSKRLPLNFKAQLVPSPAAFLCDPEAELKKALKRVKGAVTINEGKATKYLPHDQARVFLTKTCPGYNVQKLSAGDLTKIERQGSGPLTVFLSIRAASKLFEHKLTLFGLDLTAYNQQLAHQSSSGGRRHVVTNKYGLSGGDTLKECPKGYVRVERPTLPSLYLTLEDAEALLARITGKKRREFSPDDLKITLGQTVRVIATSKRGCRRLFASSERRNEIGLGSSIEWSPEAPNDLTEHIKRTLPPINQE